MFSEFMMLYPMTTYCFFAVISLAIGSLLNVIIYRLPSMLHTEWTSQCREHLSLPKEPLETINLFVPRSFCPGCKNSIPFWHNIPIVSYCVLRGKCCHCQNTIPLRYPFVEATCLILSLAAAYRFGFHLELLGILLFIWILICLFFIDLQHQILPDSLSICLLWLGLMINTQGIFTSLPSAVFSAAGAYLSLWLLIQLYYLMTGKIGMGNGDFKLFAAFGAWFGPASLLLIIFISSITGAITGLIYLKMTQKTRETPIPFGPFLCISGLITLFYGQAIISWYLQT